MSEHGRSLHEVIENTVELAASHASEKGLALVCNLAPACRDTHGFDAWCITQILTNLLSNALRYTTQGSVTVSASCEHFSGGDYINIHVIDTGPGFTGSRQQAALATPDQREMLDDSEGVGFGLLISNQLCEIFGGEITIESDPTQGTTITLTAPVFESNDDTRDSSRITNAFRNTYALIIDNDVAAKRLLEAHLRSWGLLVSSVLDKQSAIAVLDEKRQSGKSVSMLFASHQLERDALIEILQKLSAQGDDTAMLVMIGDDMSTSTIRLGLDNLSRASLAVPVKASELFDCISQHPYVKETMDTPTESSASDAAAPAPKSTPHVLLVEDNIVNQCVASEILKRIGTEVSVANNGIEAVGLLERNQYDFVFMDCQMPEMDGYEATRRIRSKPSLAELPVVALTANALSGDRQKCMDAGMSDYLTKPFTKAQLEAMLGKWLGEDRVGTQDETHAVDASAEQSQSEIELVDETALAEIRQLDNDGETSIFDEIVLEYKVSSKDLMARIAQGVSGDDPDAVQRAAHALKSSSAALGLRHFSEQCARLENLGQQGDQRSISELWPSAEDIYQRSVSALDVVAEKKVA
ncbi:MAG: response regulator [Pseudomonadota bacterium]